MTSTSEPATVARFDDLRSGEVFRFEALTGEILARTPEEVLPALAEVERATAAGRWAFGFVAYEAAAGLDEAFPASKGPPGLPLVWFGLADAPATPTALPEIGGTFRAGTWQLEWSAAEHAAHVRAVRAAIAKGETYQCNLTTRMTATVDGDPLGLYRRLVTNQRGAYNAYLDLGRFVVTSASPECFLHWHGDRLTSVPMKGTAPRGLTVQADHEARDRLVGSRKDRAENVMIVDLIRNDLARVAEPGTVEVTDLLAAERYSTVWQLTSTVSGRTRPTTTLPEVFRALFPCGSVTGAPKARTMHLIDQLESAPRGVYCGAIGYVAPGPARRARFNVGIRTAVVDREHGTATYGVGGGVTWGSTADGEYREILTKARVLHAPPEPEFDLIETVRLTPNGAVNLEAHLNRLSGSARYFGFALDREAVVSAMEAAAGHLTRDCLARVTLTRDGDVGVTTRSATFDAGDLLTLAVDTVPIDPGSRFVHHKTTVRDAYDAARRRHPDVDDVVLVNPDGRVTETTVANLAAQLDGVWVTPPLEDGCLPGVGREMLLEQSVLTERSLTVAELRAAEAVALVSSARGWRRARVTPAGTGAPVRPVTDGR